MFFENSEHVSEKTLGNGHHQQYYAKRYAFSGLHIRILKHFGLLRTHHDDVLPMSDCDRRREISKLLNFVKTSRAFRTTLTASNTQPMEKNTASSCSLPPPAKFRRKHQSFPEDRLQPLVHTPVEPPQIEQNQYPPSGVEDSEYDNILLKLMETITIPDHRLDTGPKRIPVESTELEQKI